MIDESINSIINNLCEKFGTTVDNIIPEVARYQAVTYGVQFIIGIICLIIALLLIRLFVKNKLDPDVNYIAIIFIFVIFIFFIIAGIVNLITGLNTFVWIFAPKGAFVNYVYSLLK